MTKVLVIDLLMHRVPLNEEQKAGIERVCMDLWPAYLKATREALNDADSCIAFDRFRVAQYLGKVVDQVRKQEHQQLVGLSDDRMKGRKYEWLRNRRNMSRRQQLDFSVLRYSSLKTARAWAIKEFSSQLWDYRSRKPAKPYASLLRNKGYKLAARKFNLSKPCDWLKPVR